MQLRARSANYLQSDLFGDAPKCGEMRPLAAILYAHLYAHLAAVQSTIAQFETVRARGPARSKFLLPGPRRPSEFRAVEEKPGRRRTHAPSR